MTTPTQTDGPAVKDWRERDSFVKAYAEAALFFSVDDSGDAESLTNEHCLDDIAPETWEQFQADCDGFREKCGDLLLRARYGAVEWTDAQLMGQDFWLSRNGHGAGFFDRGNEPVWRELQAAAKTFGEVNLYVGDDGKIYA